MLKLMPEAEKTSDLYSDTFWLTLTATHLNQGHRAVGCELVFRLSWPAVVSHCPFLSGLLHQLKTTCWTFCTVSSLASALCCLLWTVSSAQCVWVCMLERAQKYIYDSSPSAGCHHWPSYWVHISLQREDSFRYKIKSIKCCNIYIETIQWGKGVWAKYEDVCVYNKSKSPCPLIIFVFNREVA